MYGLSELSDDRPSASATPSAASPSTDGFFVDNAMRVDGKLQVTRNRTEVCQYFAFFFDVATPETHPELWQHLLQATSAPSASRPRPSPKSTRPTPSSATSCASNCSPAPASASRLLDESLAYLLYMADRTGTLWENDGAYASCNHGFASHGGVHVLYRDVLGLQDVDTVNKHVRLRFTDTQLDWCEGRMPTTDGPVELRWRKEDGKRIYQVVVPAGYTIKTENRSTIPAVQR